MKQFLPYYLLIFFFVVACQTEKKKDGKPVLPNTEVKEEKQKTPQASTIPKKQLATAAKLIGDTATDEVEKVNAKKIFNRNCALCHGPNGKMSINGSKKLNLTNTSLEERVAQVYFGKGTMTAFKGLLKDAEIIAVAGYIDELK